MATLKLKPLAEVLRARPRATFINISQEGRISSFLRLPQSPPATKLPSSSSLKRPSKVQRPFRRRQQPYRIKTTPPPPHRFHKHNLLPPPLHLPPPLPHHQQRLQQRHQQLRSTNPCQHACANCPANTATPPLGCTCYSRRLISPSASRRCGMWAPSGWDTTSTWWSST